MRWLDPIKLMFISLDTSAIRPPKDFLNVILIRKAVDEDDMDMMLAYDNDPLDNCLYLGHWNDGRA